MALFLLIPEEEHALLLFVPGCLGREDGLQGIGVVAGCPAGGGYGERCGGEVLHLLQLEVQVLGLDGQFGHVLCMATGMAADEIGYYLLIEAFPATDVIKDFLELVEQAEGGLAHDIQHVVRGVLGSYFESAAYVVADEFSGVFAGCPVKGFVLPVMQQKVISDAAADEALLDIGYAVHLTIDFQQGTVVAVQVGAYLGMDAGGAFAYGADFGVFAVHHVHIGTGAAQVTEVAFEVGQLGYLPYLPKDALLGPAHDEFALVGADGAEGAASEAAPMHVDAELDHVIGGDALAVVLGMRQAGVGEVKAVVQLFLREWGEGGIDYDPFALGLLKQALGVQFIAFLLNMTEILGVQTEVGKAVLIAVQYDVVLTESAGYLMLFVYGYGLGDFILLLDDVLKGVPCDVGFSVFIVIKRGVIFFQGLGEQAGYHEGGFFAHAVGDDIGVAVY